MFPSNLELLCWECHFSIHSKSSQKVTSLQRTFQSKKPPKVASKNKIRLEKSNICLRITDEDREYPVKTKGKTRSFHIAEALSVHRRQSNVEKTLSPEEIEAFVSLQKTVKEACRALLSMFE